MDNYPTEESALPIRLAKAIRLEAADRTPVVLQYAGFAAVATGRPMSRFLGSVAESVATMMEAFELVGGADAIHYGAYSPYALSRLWMSKVRVPGVDLPDNGVMQVVEAELMREEDYDRILVRGWPEFCGEFLEQRVFEGAVPVVEEVDVRRAWAKRGVAVLSGGDISPPFELLCGARSLNGFCGDLLTIPDKVEEAMREMAPHLAGPVCDQARRKGYPAVWVGGWRSASKMVSPRVWQRFVWPYLEWLVNEVVRSGLIAVLHLDADWTRDLGYFRSLPRGHCIMATDGKTDLRKAKELIGDRMCLMGDVPAELLAFGTSDAVYRYCRELIRDLGPVGFILHSGCDIPENARMENVRAMVAAATGG